MHWLTLVFIILISVLILVVVVLFGFMLSSRPTEVNRLAGEPPFGQPKSQQREPITWTLGNHGDAWEQKLSHMSDEELTLQLQQLVAGQPTREEEVLPDRAAEMLGAVTRNVGAGDEQYRGEGRGIVICAGGFEHGTNGLLLVGNLRRLGCTLPLEVFHRNNEMSPEMQRAFEAFAPLTVRNIEALSSVALNNIWALKPLSAYYSSFQQVLVLDADNLCLKDPTYLFEYLSEEVPAVFWPDHWPLDRKAQCWQTLKETQLARINYSLCQESGQLLVDKSRCLRALNVCSRVNVQLSSQLKRLFPEPFNHGDKDTWHWSWLVTDTPFQMISHRPSAAGVLDSSGQFVGSTNVQKDRSGENLFLHKLRGKWAHQTQSPQWTTVQSFLNNQRGWVHPTFLRLEGGPVVVDKFRELIGEATEDQCWSSLRALRAEPWYQAQFANELKDLER